jgi:hypothetical protein
MRIHKSIDISTGEEVLTPYTAQEEAFADAEHAKSVAEDVSAEMASEAAFEARVDAAVAKALAKQ